MIKQAGMNIKEIYLQTSRLDQLKEFYSNILQLKVENSSSEIFTLFTTNTNVIFEKALKHDPVYHFAFNIPSNKIHEASQWLMEKMSLMWLKDYESYIADFINWNAQSVYFMDPAGNIVEFISRFDLNDNVSSAFSPEQIRSVSEIGLVFSKADYHNRVNAILSECPLTYFSKQPSHESFCAIGDDEGLFICVEEGRAWYPTVKEGAGIFPLKVLFEKNDKKYVYTL